MEIIIWDKCDWILTEKKPKGHCPSDFVKYACISMYTYAHKHTYYICTL